MNYEFVTISLSKEEELPYPKMRNFFGEKWYRKKLLKKLEVIETSVSYMKEEGISIRLPFTKENIVNYDKKYLTEFANKLVKKKNIHSIYIQKDLRKYLPFPYENRAWLMKYILFKEWFEMTLSEFGIESKQMKLIVMDSGDRKISYILDNITRDLNYLTIITDRKEYFNDFSEKVYSTTGLVVDFVRPGEKEMLEGNVVIDANSLYYKEYRRFEKNVIALDLDSTINKIQYLYARRNNFKIVYDIIAKKDGNIIDNELACEIICNKERLAREFIHEGCKACSKGYLKSFAPQYHIEIAGIKKL